MKNKTITIVKVTDSFALDSIKTADRLGGRQHGMAGKVMQTVTDKVDARKFVRQLSSNLEEITRGLDSLNKVAGEFTADEITIGIAVSGEGSIGIATVGAEASIQVTFVRKKES